MWGFYTLVIKLSQGKKHSPIHRNPSFHTNPLLLVYIFSVAEQSGKWYNLGSAPKRPQAHALLQGVP